MFRKKIRIDDIKISDDRRPVHYETAKGIADSFRLVGQIHPIVIDEDDNLIAGRHRVEAAKLCEWTTIEASVMEPGPEADLVECDENLQRHGLDALQFSLAVNRRKKAWEALNGKAQRGAKPKQGGNCAQVAHNSDAKPPTTFAEETAVVAGVSRATVDRAVALAENLTDEAVEVLADTPIADNKTALAAIAAEPKSKQVAAARRAVKAGKVEKKPTKRDEDEHWLDGLQSPYDVAILSIQSAARLVKEISSEEKTGAHLAHLGTFSHIKRNLDEAIQHIKANKPAAGCPKCGDYEIRGKGCKQCYGTGFISAVVHKGLTAKV